VIAGKHDATAMTGARADWRAGLAPRSLFARLILLLAGGLVLAQSASLGLVIAMPVSPWIVGAFFLQLALLLACGWMAMRRVIRPLTRLAEAADAMGPELTGPLLDEVGPTEVVRTARAFNSMQRRIDAHLRERIQILAAISHDLKTPITRMRLRADLLDDAQLRDKLHGDLDAMHHLVEDGLAYARDGQGITETACRTDLDALLDSLAHDYASAGQQVRLRTRIDGPFTTRPNAVRRIVTNLIDNALKFGDDAEVEAESVFGGVRIRVTDRGPGIPPAELRAVLLPFYRVEASRNRDTGGSGLGLAIVLQLTRALGGTLALVNRRGGGLEARVFLPDATVARRFSRLPPEIAKVLDSPWVGHPPMEHPV